MYNLHFILTHNIKYLWFSV